MTWLVLLGVMGLGLFGLLPPEVEACRYTVRDVAMVDLAEPHYVFCLVTKEAWPSARADSLAAAAAGILVDSNVEFRLVVDDLKDGNGVDRAGKPADPVNQTIRALGVASYPAFILLAPDGRTLRLSLESKGPLEINGPSIDGGFAVTGNSIQVASLRRGLRMAIGSPRRAELLRFLLRGHSVVLIVEGIDDANNQRAISWVEGAIERVRDALPTMAKPIELPPRMIRLTPEEAKREEVLLWSLGLDLAHETSPAHSDHADHAAGSPLSADEQERPGQERLAEQPSGRERAKSSVTQIALLFGRGRKLGPVLRIPGSRQQDLWRSLGVVGEDCECGLDRSWMRGPMIPHAWSTTDEADAVAALGFDPGNPLVKAEISRILARGPLRSGLMKSARAQAQGTNRSLQKPYQPLQPRLQLAEIDIDALVSDETTVSQGEDSPANLSPTAGTQEFQAAGNQDLQVAREPDFQVASELDLPVASEGGDKGSTTRVLLLWILVALSLVGVLGSLGLILRGWRNQV